MPECQNKRAHQRFNSLKTTLYACFMPCLIQLFSKNFYEKLEIFRKIIELDKAEIRGIM